MDYLSNEVKLTISKNGDTRLKTIYGGSLSILSVITALAFALYFFISLVNKDNIYLAFSNEVSANSNLSDSNTFPFLLRLTDKNNVPFKTPKEIYSIYLKYWSGGDNSSSDMAGQSTVDIDIEPCDLNKHFAKYRELFVDIKDIHTFYCPRPRMFNETIHGIYGGINPFGYYHFYIAMCYQKDYCKPLDEIQKITQNVYLDFRTVEFGINSFRKTAKTELVLTERYMLSSSVYKRIWYYYSGVKYITDTGLFFSSTEEDYFSLPESTRYDIDHRDIFTGTIPGTFVTMTILNTGTVHIYYRKYLKIQDYIASIGGIVKFVQLIGFLLNYYFGLNSYRLKLINDLHVFQKMNNKTETKAERLYTSVIKSNFHLMNVGHRNSMNDSKANLQQFKTKFKLKMWYHKMLPFNCLPSHQSDIIQKSMDVVNANMNIIGILTRLEENQVFIKAVMSNDKVDRGANMSNTKLNYLKNPFNLKPVKSLWLKEREMSDMINPGDVQEDIIINKKSK